ncbi:hypothetical protein KK083_04115 [Fulvivirgaceae bacterium PWU4]|uniref:Uncharacterized protein n=1 Tax=Chryseosolibacter histidini TaxID=2782349 RepID=A0AAP2DI74_9BACT|nr:hypothetical protein [Chryseosolibacter histidini]MBT1696049.1 hypothetical protein [Chryseosolibacter histidini]
MKARNEDTVINYLSNGKYLYFNIEDSSEYNEPATTKLTIWKTKSNKFNLSVQKFLDKHFFAEDLYIRDEVLNFNSLDELRVALIDQFGVQLQSFHG